MRNFETFEQAYRHLPFSELVRLGISLAESIRKQRRSGRSKRIGKTGPATARA